MNQRENALCIFEGREPEFIPDVKEAVQWMPIPIIERPDKYDGYDDFGVRWTYDKKTDGCYYTPGQKKIVDNMCEWRATVRFPEFKESDWKKSSSCIKRFQDKVYGVSIWMGMLERLEALCSMEDALCNMLLEPEAVSDFFSELTKYKIGLIERCQYYLKPDFIVLHDDWGMENGLFVSRKTWLDLIKPYTKRMYDTIISKGSYVIQHSCGQVESLIGDIIEMGATGWESYQKCNNLEAIVEKHGEKLVFFGEIDIRHFLNCDYKEEAVRDYYKNTIRILSKYGRYFPESEAAGKKDLAIWFKEELALHNKED